MNVECPKCMYSWEYKGKLLRGTCPNCGAKCFTNKDNKEEKEKKET